MGFAEEFSKYKKGLVFDLPEECIINKFRSVHDDIKHSRHSEYVLSGGRGSSKSSFLGFEVIDCLKNNKNMHALVCRNIGNTLKDSVYAQIVWCIEALGLSEEFEFSKSPLEITLKATRQKIYFRGADDPMKIKSIKPAFGYIGILWFEELDQFCGENAVRSIRQSAIRGGDKSYVFMSFNPPKTNMNWANLYVKTPKDKRLTVHNTYLDVPKEWLGSSFLEEAQYLKETNPEAYEHEYMGVANGTGGAVFDNVVIRRITNEEIKIFDRIYRGIDWGWYPDPNRYVQMYYNSNRRALYIFGEISCNKTPNDKFAKMLLDYGVKKSDEITADSAATELKSINDFRSWGFGIRGAIKGSGSVEAGMKWLCSLNEIIIDDKRAPNTAKEFLEYEYEKDRNGNVISGYPDKNNHSIDAVRYAMERVWRRRGK